MISSRRRPRAVSRQTDACEESDLGDEPDQPRFSLQALKIDHKSSFEEKVSESPTTGVPMARRKRGRGAFRWVIVVVLLLGTVLYTIFLLSWTSQVTKEQATHHIESTTRKRSLTTRRSDAHVKVNTRRGAGLSMVPQVKRKDDESKNAMDIEHEALKKAVSSQLIATTNAPLQPMQQQAAMMQPRRMDPRFGGPMQPNQQQQIDPRWNNNHPQAFNNAMMQQWPGAAVHTGGLTGPFGSYPQQPFLGGPSSGMPPPDPSGRLLCDVYGGPPVNSKVVDDMMYWRTDTESDASFVSPYFDETASKYLTFELDPSISWDQQRMMFESAVVLAHAMGRVLILPPRSYSDTNATYIGDVFLDVRVLSQRYRGIQIVTMEDFFNTPGLLRSLKQARPDVLPPFFRNTWDIADNVEIVWQYFRQVGHMPFSWNGDTCIVAFPDGDSTETLEELMTTIWEMRDGRPRPQYLDFQGRPVAVNAPTIERLREMTAGRKKLCTYDEAMQHERIIHFAMDDASHGSPLAIHFYSWIFFEDWKTDLWYKRLVRDQLRYNDMVLCAAARIVESLAGSYDSIHIRRKSFEEEHSDVTSDMSWIVTEIKGLLRKDAPLFLATDEPDASSWLQPLSDAYKVVTLSNYKEQMSSVPPILHGMVEQVVLARADMFVGTFYSSFSGYVNRLRGYYSTKHSTNHQQDDGSIQSYYYSPSSMKREMRIYRAIRKPFIMREFPIAWRDIDDKEARITTTS